MANRNGIHHVVLDPDVSSWPKTALCGRTVNYHDMPIGIEHAKACVKSGTYLQPCKHCFRKIPTEQE